MKLIKLILIGALFLVANCLIAQNDDGKKIEYQIKTRSSFYYVDNRYNILKDTIYHSNDGFRVFSGYDIDKDATGKEFLIFTYPDWNGKKQIRPKQVDYQEKIFRDSLFLVSINNMYIGEPNKGLIYEEILDSLFILSEIEKLKKPVHVELSERNGVKLAIEKDVFEKFIREGKVEDVYSLKWKYSTNLASGMMTVPFKLRPKEDTVNFNMTTDVTLGAYFGVKKRISRSSKTM